MPQYNDTLSTMVSRVLAAKPNAQQSEVVRQINERIRSAINSQIYWADLLVRRIISIPAPYTTGTLSLATASTFAIGGGTTSFPVNDVVNTTSNTQVFDYGFQQIFPASMAGIAVDRYLYCDAGNQSVAETVAVVQISPTSFWAKFNNPHATAFTMTSSSLAGLQLNVGMSYPIYTCRAIRDANTVEMDNPWGGPPLTSVQYQLYLIYATIDPNLKVLLDCIDQVAGRVISVYVPVEIVDKIDPQRTATGDPLALVQHSPSEAGSFCQEIWPAPQNARQLWVLCGLQWPELIIDSDRPPWFMDPNMFVNGAIADALRIKNIRFAADSDPYFNPQLARDYEMKYQNMLQLAVNANESKAQRAYSHNWEEIFGNLGANYWQRHDISVDFWTL